MSDDAELSDARRAAHLNACAAKIKYGITIHCWSIGPTRASIIRTEASTPRPAVTSVPKLYSKSLPAFLNNDTENKIEGASFIQLRCSGTLEEVP